MEIIKQEEKEQLDKILENPFKSDKIRRITIDLWNYPFTGEQRMEGFVRFENGNTSGTQRFDEKDLLSILNKIDLFIKSL